MSACPRFGSSPQRVRASGAWAGWALVLRMAACARALGARLSVRAGRMRPWRVSRARACKLACITQASCANAQNARCAQPRRAPACRDVCRPPAAHSTRNSELHLMMPIVLYNPAKPDCSVQLKQSSLSSMCRSNCRCRLSAIP